MQSDTKVPKWAQLPKHGPATCRICGQPIYGGHVYEAIKPKGRETLFFHRACIRKEREDIEKCMK